MPRFCTPRVSTKNETESRDPEMRQTRKGKQWYFEMKVQTGSDLKGLVHSIHTTDAAQADITQLPVLLSGDERVLYGDQAYWSQGHREMLEELGVAYWVNRRGTKAKPLTEHEKRINRANAAARLGRACVSHGEGDLRHHEGAVSRAPEEHGPGVRGLHAGEPVSRPETTAAEMGDVSLRTGPIDGHTPSPETTWASPEATAAILDAAAAARSA